MLPDLDLDNERYDDILENARNMIVSIYPEWTDFNYHDPGVTMLELFAWLKEIQQYYLNKIGPANIEKYLKLMGISRRTKKPSKAEVRIRCGEDIVAAKGTKLYAGGICFEADEKTYISSARIACCISRSGDEQHIVEGRELSFGGSLRISPFPRGDSGEFLIGFDKPLQSGEYHSIRFGLRDQGTVPRNPVTDPRSFIPLTDISAEYFDGAGWKTLGINDGTYGFLFSGSVSFKLDSEHGRCSVCGREAYFIRFRLTGGEFDELPSVRSIDFDLLPVTQRDTAAEYFDLPAGGELKVLSELSLTGETKIFLRGKDGLFTSVPYFEKLIDEKLGTVEYRLPDTGDAEEVRIINISQEQLQSSELGFGTGLPYQEYDLGDLSFEYESFTIMTELPASGGKYAEWKKVRDFSGAGSDDFVYVFDSSKGIVRFGDCIRGMAPEGRIFIIGCSRTLGADGNVSVGKISRMGSTEDEDIVISNPQRSEGGCAEETPEECCVRAYTLLRTTETLVTDEDCERFISGVQGLKIEKSKVIRIEGQPDNVTSVVVRPYSPDGQGAPSERYTENILAAVEKRRLLGTRFRIVRPEYSAVSVFADVIVSRSVSDARKIVQATISEFFESLRDQFGAKIIYSRLYELIDRLDCVLNINMLTMETDGSGAQRTREGDLLLAANVTAYLDDTELITGLG